MNLGRVVDIIVDQLTGENRVVIYTAEGDIEDGEIVVMSMDIVRVHKNVSLASLNRVVRYLEKAVPEIKQEDGSMKKWMEGDKEGMDTYLWEHQHAQLD